MKKRVYSSVLIVLLLAILFVLKIFVSDYFFDAFFGVIACIASFEMSRLLSKTKRYNFQMLSVIFPAIILACHLICAHYAVAHGDIYWILWAILIDFALMFVVLMGTFLIQLIRKKKVLEEMTTRDVKNMSVAKFALKKCLNTLIIFVYPAFFFLFMVFVNHMGDLPLSKFADVSVDFSIFILMTAILIPMLSDTFAMLTGSLIGGKKLCPRISPGKTISGTVGGAVWTLLLMSAVWLIFANINGFDFMWSSFPIWAYLIIILIGVGIAVAGDLFESILKRHSGVKDSGRLVPGHGGILDRIDSYIFIAPYIMLAFWIFAL